MNIKIGDTFFSKDGRFTEYTIAQINVFDGHDDCTVFLAPIAGDDLPNIVIPGNVLPLKYSRRNPKVAVSIMMGLILAIYFGFFYLAFWGQ